MNITPTEPKYGASKDYLCYFDDKTFILPISAASRINLEALKFALIDMLGKIDED